MLSYKRNRVKGGAGSGGTETNPSYQGLTIFIKKIFSSIALQVCLVTTLRVVTVVYVMAPYVGASLATRAPSVKQVRHAVDACLKGLKINRLLLHCLHKTIHHNE